MPTLAQPPIGLVVIPFDVGWIALAILAWMPFPCQVWAFLGQTLAGQETTTHTKGAAGWIDFTN